MAVWWCYSYFQHRRGEIRSITLMIMLKPVDTADWRAHFIFIYLCRVKYAAIEADLYTALPKQKLNILITVIYKGKIYTKNYMH